MNMASSSTSTFIKENITDEHTEQHSLRCYRPRHLYFNTSMEEEDIMEWLHLEPSMHQRVLMPPPSNKNTRSTKNSRETSTEDNEILIHKLCTKVQSLKSENIRLRGQIRYLKYRLRHVPQKRKTSKNKQKNI